MADLLVIEDDPAIRFGLVRALGERGHVVTTFPTGISGLQQVIDTRPDLVVLDLGLPDVDGLQILSMLRAVSAVPVIVVTARDEDDVIVGALNAGADDYVVKPFGAEQLDARIRAVLRRASAVTEEGPVTVGDLVVDAVTRQVTLKGVPVELSRREFDLLLLLAQRAGEVVSKRDILEHVWDFDFDGDPNIVEVYIGRLRRKIDEPFATPMIETVRGAGYRLKDGT